MTDDHGRETTRRSVLAAALAAVLPAEGIARATSTTELTAATPTAAREPSRAVFPQGVASGDPTQTGAVVWTRVAPDAVTDGSQLRLTVARDETFEETVGSWRVPTDGLEAHDNTAKIDLDGELTPGSRFAYRFYHGGAASPTGHCRTLPAADASPDSVRLGLATCQDYRRGYYGAYHHLGRESVDFLVHLGDFIYEHGGGGEYPDRTLSLPSGNGIASGLEDYRYLHRTYRTDEFLQAALAAHTLVPVWDDHEIVNNRYWDYEEGRPYAGRGDHPRNDEPKFMTELFADGIRAWWEYTPTRVSYDPDADSLLDRLDLWRQFDFGDLLTLLVTDERLYRTSPTAGTQFGADVGSDSAAQLTETMLGAEQREWFTEALSGAETT